MKQFSGFTLVVILFVIMCGFGSDSAITPIWKYPADIKLPNNRIELPAIGCGLVVSAESLNCVGTIRGMATDRNGSSYVLDNSFNEIWKFSPTGKVVWKSKIDSSHSAARIADAVAKGIAVASNDMICVGDYLASRAVLFDSNGTYINSFKVGLPPGAMIFGKDNTLYLAGFAFQYKGPYIQHYDLQGKLIGSLYNRDSLTHKGERSGEPGKFAIDGDGNIYYSLYSPYQILKFSPDGKLLASFSKPHVEHQELRDTVVEGIKSRILIIGGVKGLEIIHGTYLAASVVAPESVSWELDLYTLNGTYLKTIPSTSLPREMKYFQCWTSDTKEVVTYYTTYPDYCTVQSYRVPWEEWVKK